MTIAEVSPGIYRIAVVRASGVAPGELLTRQSGGGVTVLPPGAQPDPEQEVISRFLTSSIVCRSPTLLVENHPWSRAGKHHHHDPLPDASNLLPYLQRRPR